MQIFLQIFCIAVFFVVSMNASAETYEVGPRDDWFALLSGRSLKPGDEIVLRSGVYSDGRLLAIRHSGAVGKPIVIKAADGATVTFRRPDAKQNTINLMGNQHLHLIGIEITGGSTGMRISPDGDRQPSDIVIQEMHIHHVGGAAITCNHVGGIYRRITFHRNHIHHTTGHAEGFYLGGNNATAIMSDSTISENYVHHLNGPGVSQGDGIEVKQGSFNNRIIGNIIHDTGYPGITVYGTAGEAVNQITANLIWNTGDHGIQVAADAVVQNNFVSEAAACGIYSRKHQGAVPNRLRIENNYVKACGDSAIRIIGESSNDVGAMVDIQILKNQLFAGKKQSAFRMENVDVSLAAGNVGTGTVQGSPIFAASWNTLKVSTTASRAKLPNFIDHPAWNFLDQNAVRARFLNQ